MLTRTTYRFQRLSRTWRIGFGALGTALAIFILTQSLGTVHAPPSVSNMDKIVHALAYFSLGFAAFPAFGRLRPLYGGTILVAYGGMIELLQGSMNRGRTADIFDVAANTVGVMLAFLVLLALSKLWPNVRNSSL